MLLFWDLISISIWAIVIAPIVLYYFTKDIAYIYILIGIVVCELFIKLSRTFKYSKNLHKIVYRPNTAMNCSIFNRGGSFQGRIGMPSGHVMLTAFTLSAIFIHQYGLGKKGSHQIEGWLIVLIAIILMSASRMYKKCHNIWQVIIGAILGIGAACFIQVSLYLI
jgi:membrane-associated phospholipid phosphatase